MVEHLEREHHHVVPEATRTELEGAVRRLDIMPSMRALMTAGPALAQSHIACYNCSYLPISHTDAFHEVLYILLHGTGVGFSVERQYTGKLPSHMTACTCGGNACPALLCSALRVVLQCRLGDSSAHWRLKAHEAALT